jgi:hypothetical protein
MKRCFKHSRYRKVAVLTASICGLSCFAAAQYSDTVEPAGTASPEASPSSSANPADQRILGVIPNYQTVSDPHQEVVALSVAQKFLLFSKETFDPFTAFAAVTGAALSQADHDDPKYGRGAGPYGERFGAAPILGIVVIGL